MCCRHGVLCLAKAMGDTPPGVEPGSERDTSHIAGVFRRTVRPGLGKLFLTRVSQVQLGRGIWFAFVCSSSSPY